MSKRISVTEDDAVLIEVALRLLHKDSIAAASVYPEREIASAQRIKQIVNKLPLPRKVEEPTHE